MDDFKQLFEDLPEAQRRLAYDTIDDYSYFTDRVKALRQLPDIRVNKSNPYIQQLTPAAKLIKEYSQILDNKRKVLLTILHRSDNDSEDGNVLADILKQFEDDDIE